MLVHKPISIHIPIHTGYKNKTRCAVALAWPPQCMRGGGESRVAKYGVGVMR